MQSAPEVKTDDLETAANEMGMRQENTAGVTESEAEQTWPERQLKGEPHPGIAAITADERNRLLGKVAMEYGYKTPQRVENMKIETSSTSASKKTTPSTSSTSCALRKTIGKVRELQRRQRRRLETRRHQEPRDGLRSRGDNVRLPPEHNMGHGGAGHGHG